METLFPSLAPLGEGISRRQRRHNSTWAQRTGFALQGSSASALPPSSPLATRRSPRQKEATWALKGGKNVATLRFPVYSLSKAPGQAEGRDTLGATLSTEVSHAHHKSSCRGISRAEGP